MSSSASNDNGDTNPRISHDQYHKVYSLSNQPFQSCARLCTEYFNPNQPGPTATKHQKNQLKTRIDLIHEAHEAHCSDNAAELENIYEQVQKDYATFRVDDRQAERQDFKYFLEDVKSSFLKEVILELRKKDGKPMEFELSKFGEQNERPLLPSSKSRCMEDILRSKESTLQKLLPDNINELFSPPLSFDKLAVSGDLATFRYRWNPINCELTYSAFHKVLELIRKDRRGTSYTTMHSISRFRYMEYMDKVCTSDEQFLRALLSAYGIDARNYPAKVLALLHKRELIDKQKFNPRNANASTTAQSLASPEQAASSLPTPATVPRQHTTNTTPVSSSSRSSSRSSTSSRSSHKGHNDNSYRTEANADENVEDRDRRQKFPRVEPVVCSTLGHDEPLRSLIGQQDVDERRNVPSINDRDYRVQHVVQSANYPLDTDYRSRHEHQPLQERRSYREEVSDRQTLLGATRIERPTTPTNYATGSRHNPTPPSSNSMSKDIRGMSAEDAEFNLSFSRPRKRTAPIEQATPEKNTNSTSDPLPVHLASFYSLPYDAWKEICHRTRQNIEKSGMSSTRVKTLGDEDYKILYARYLNHIEKNYSTFVQGLLTAYPDVNVPEEVYQILKSKEQNGTTSQHSTSEPVNCFLRNPDKSNDRLNQLSLGSQSQLNIEFPGPDPEINNDDFVVIDYGHSHKS